MYFHSYLDLDIIALLGVKAGDHILIALTIHLRGGINLSKELFIQIYSKIQKIKKVTKISSHIFNKELIPLGYTPH